MSTVTIKSRIKSYLLFYLYVFDEGTLEVRKRKAVISSADIVLRGIGEPSQFRGAICSFAFLHRNVRHSAVCLARRTCFRLQQVYGEDSATPFHTCTQTLTLENQAKSKRRNSNSPPTPTHN